MLTKYEKSLMVISVLEVVKKTVSVSHGEGFQFQFIFTIHL